MTLGTEPVAARADFSNVEAAFAHATPQRATRIVSFDGNWQHAKFSFAVEAAALQHALPMSTFRFDKSSAKTCAPSTLRVRHQS